MLYITAFGSEKDPARSNRGGGLGVVNDLVRGFVKFQQWKIVYHPHLSNSGSTS